MLFNNIDLWKIVKMPPKTYINIYAIITYDFLSEYRTEKTWLSTFQNLKKKTEKCKYCTKKD